ncbi:hypothetical protein [Aquisalinus flavus]|uniref:Uncharacterized protein n=1 Tax=Aquisalinus flavus TaxID=1526572 RepID=A0A8J2V3A2_9PROT|nr:hypothetical protein [Aquisalinus flavus]MBD0425760.1 hypothetical protein [Aquisalinus flavus]UNE48631.1 hypothetical protein FF099_11525 [Aquisalinus flavus]GGD13497.1 hypothetical protein GCM10011342_22820 [Aquisalinus flavus]
MIASKNSVPIAENLQADGPPFIVTSGYSESQQPEIFSSDPCLSKPVPVSRLPRLVERASIYSRCRAASPAKARLPSVHGSDLKSGPYSRSP